MKPRIIKPNGDAAAMSPAQLECIDKLTEALESAKNGDILSCIIIACGPSDFGLAIAGADAPRLNLGLDAAKQEIIGRVTGPRRSVLHR